MSDALFAVCTLLIGIGVGFLLGAAFVGGVGGGRRR